MMKTMHILIVAAATVLAPIAAQAQGAARGVNDGVAVGNRAGGPVGGVVGGVVGGAVGAATGVVAGVLGVEQRPRFREYAIREHHPSYAYREDLRVGAVLPESGVTYYEVPADYGVRSYRYTVVNDRTVLVDPATHRVVEIVD